MKSIDVEELRSIQMQMMDSIDNFCAKRGLRYFLMYGSLIGAVRHQGYIPWDDDIDIIMPRPDYDVFVNEYYDENYSVVNREKDKKWKLLYSKVCDDRTVMLEDNGLRCGVYVDVFPLDGLSSDEKKAYAHFRYVMQLKLLLRLHLFAPRMRLGKDTFMAALVAKLIHSFVPYGILYKRFYKAIRKFDFENSCYIGDLCAGAMNQVFEAKEYSEYMKGCFEGHQYRLPVGYDSILRKIYGDYMILPPKSDRVSNHTFEAYWKD